MKKYEQGTPRVAEKYRITITQNGPYLIFGNPEIRLQTIVQNSEGNSWQYVAGEHNYDQGSEPVALCRCGHSKNAPYCDGSHLRVDCDLTLTADHKPLLVDALQLEGPSLTLTDNEKYCSFARFCDAKGRTWSQTEASDDPVQRELAIRTAANCPSGRLKEWDNATGETLEPKFTPSIGLLQDPAIGVSGPIWVRGGIPITNPDGFTYEVRNRVTLCRCGNSLNKPFCDGTHVSSRYHDNIVTK